MKAARHVVQISLDDSIFAEQDSEALRRQVRYAEILDGLSPGSRITTLVLARRRGSTKRSFGTARFVPIEVDLGGARKLEAWYKLLRELWRTHRELPIDALTTQTVYDEAWAVLLFARLLDLRVVGQVHFDVFNSDAQEEVSRTWVSRRVRFALMQRLLHLFSGLRPVGQRIAAELKHFAPDCDVRTIPVKMEMLALHPPQADRRAHRKVLFVGRLVPQKGLETWLEVATRVLEYVGDATFEIVGEGGLRESLERRCAALGIAGRVLWSGSVPNDCLPKTYEDASVLLLTSRYEGFGRVVVESLSRATPVVAAKVAGVEDIIVEGRSGFLHEPGDVDGLARSVTRILLDDDLRATLGAWGAADVRERFAPERLAREWVTFMAGIDRRSALGRVGESDTPASADGDCPLPGGSGCDEQCRSSEHSRAGR